MLVFRGQSRSTGHRCEGPQIYSMPADVYIYESRCLKVYIIVTYSKVKRIIRGYVTHYTIKLTLGVRTRVISMVYLGGIELQRAYLLLHFIPLALSLLCPPIWAVLHHLYMYMVAFLALRILYVVALVCFVFVPCLVNPSLAKMSSAGYCLARFLLSAFFSFLFFSDRVRPQFVLV